MSSTSTPSRSSGAATAGGGNAVYGLGLIGALVFYLQAAQEWWEYLLAPMQAILWPAFMVYEALHQLAG
jgi:hypothetical protein